MKALSADNSCRACSGVRPLAMAAAYSGDSRMKAWTRLESVLHAERFPQAALAMFCKLLPWRVTAWLAAACSRESMVVRTTSPSP
jgi:hypothetical protein